MDRTHAGLLILALVAFGLAAVLAYENVPNYIRIERLDNVTVGKFTFHFVGNCSVQAAVQEWFGNHSSCYAWTYPQQRNVWIVTNTSLAGVFEECNHELYHLSRNTTMLGEVLEDHRYLDAHSPAWPWPATRFGECDLLMRRLLLSV